jgi:phosphocarrier protein HPr
MVECNILLDTIDKIADFIKVVSKIEYDVDLVKGRYTVDAKSVVGVFTLDLSKEVKIIIHTNDENILDKFKEWRVD